MIITIDGPSGTGKTSVAKQVAESLNFSYFDTGAMYRCVAWLALKNEIDPSDEIQVKKLLDHFLFRIERNGKEKYYFIGNKDVTNEIRSKAINRIVSTVSAMPSVRSTLTNIQRKFAKEGDAVFEGRDLGTVVFPDAEVKIFLTASPEIRAQRRLDEMLLKNPDEVRGMRRDEMLEELKRRDLMDSTRTLAPLKCPEDAYIIDTSDLSIEETVNAILNHKREKEQ